MSSTLRRSARLATKTTPVNPTPLDPFPVSPALVNPAPVSPARTETPKKANYTISEGLVNLVYNDTSPSADSKEFASSPTEASSSSEASPSSASRMSKHALEDYRKKLYSVITEYGEKLSLLGVVIKKYGPGTMKPLAYKLKENGAGTKNAEPAVVGGEGSSIKISKIKTRKLQKASKFNPKVMSQSNEKQRREARMLVKLFHKLEMDEKCDGKKLKDDIVDHMHTPYRYIYLFLKTIDDAQYVVGFVSATCDPTNRKYAVVDYICPKVTTPNDTVWKDNNMQDNFVAYVILNFLWLNNSTGDAPRYEWVTYNGTHYAKPRDVLRDKKLSTLPHINTYAATIMNFKTG
jgi:hypothetical protein